MPSSTTPPQESGGPAFGIVRHDGDDEITFVLVGEFDIGAVQAFAEATGDIPPGARTVFDMRDVTFMDSAGVRALMNLDIRARAEGFALALSDPSPRVLRVLELCAFADRIPIHRAGH